MFAHSFVAIALVFPALAAASALPQNDAFTSTTITPAAGSTTINQCNTGTLFCCNSVQSASTSSTANLLGLLGFVTGGATSLIGSNCSPITVIGEAENECTAQPVCCTGNNFSGLVVLGCNAVDPASFVDVLAESVDLLGDIFDLD